MAGDIERTVITEPPFAQINRTRPLRSFEFRRKCPYAWDCNRKAPSAMTREDRQSLILNSRALQAARHDWPGAIGVIRRNLDTMRAAKSCSARYLDKWQQLIAQGPDVLATVVLAETDEGQVLRSVSPLGGILTEGDRLRIIKDCWSEARRA